ncbi:MAG: hypothetical protein A3I26_02710 [Candidatus Yanofskybacteria bacterium RIFCSPLOWO2_02_FULL_43_10]|nr:MAG: hypothetical protein A3C69_01795 [Candidatus Yanofskybacteria bacterium RIFCSPHIGHO2_02_FULL_43_12]OGN28593.1 MAG: hypothetical protein A3I26_02710 [Candidatus Yanofskybacteria bacterium RIFCSPLOWO2_02_FULL_43_10]
MKTIATLGLSVRLVVFQFLMRNNLVPTEIPHKRASDEPPLPPVPGVEVLESTPKVDLAALANKVAFTFSGDYELVDVWQKPHERNWGMSFVRFVFCRNEYVKKDELFPDFVAQKKGLERIFVEMTSNNLWATQGHLNPYLEKDGAATGHRVLMLGCAGRIPNDWVFSGGRDENNRGIGPKVLLSTRASKLNLTDDAGIVLSAPAPIPEMASAPVA